MNQESITKGLTTPVNVIITFAHLGFHILDLSAEMVEDETYFSSKYIENNWPRRLACAMRACVRHA